MLIWEVFMGKLRFADACAEERLCAMSLIHALGRRDFPTRPRRAGPLLIFPDRAK